MDDGPIGAWTIDEATRIRMRLARAQSALDRGALDEAVLETEELLDERPAHPDALFLLGETLLELGDWELARLAYEQRVALDGGDDASLVGLAISAFHGCDLPVAIEAAREAARRDPTNAEAHYFLGLALERTPGISHDEALASLVAAYRLEPEAYPLPITLRTDDWEVAITVALDRMSQRLRAFYARVPFRVEDIPDLRELASAAPPISPTVAALYVGRPQVDIDPYDNPPIAIRVFARNLGRAGTREAVIDELERALVAEASEWLGETTEESP